MTIIPTFRKTGYNTFFWAEAEKMGRTWFSFDKGSHRNQPGLGPQRHNLLNPFLKIFLIEVMFPPAVPLFFITFPQIFLGQYITHTYFWIFISFFADIDKLCDGLVTFSFHKSSWFSLLILNINGNPWIPKALLSFWGNFVKTEFYIFSPNCYVKFLLKIICAYLRKQSSTYTFFFF